jgi:hypothetical protein
VTPQGVMTVQPSIRSASGCLLSRRHRNAKADSFEQHHRTTDLQVLIFVSRAEPLRLRGQRNYSRYMFIVKGFVDPDGPERAQWHKEFAEESAQDAEWNRRHGAVPGGAAILRWRQQRDDASVPQHVTSADANIR